MRAIDMRSRPPYKKFKDDFVFDLNERRLAAKRSGRAVAKSVEALSMDAFLEEKIKAGITKCVVPVRGSRANEDNPILVNLLQEYPDDFIGFASLSMPAEMKPEEITDLIKKYVLEGPCTGVNLEPGLDVRPWEVDDEKIFPVYDFCEKYNIPVMLLNGGLFHRNDYMMDYGLYAPMRIEHVAFTFPKLKIICAHGGWPWVELMCAVAINHENVYLSPDCYLMDGVGGKGYVEAANRPDLQDKIMFGSVYPGYSMAYAVDYFIQCGIREDIIDKVLYENAVKVLNI